MNLYAIGELGSTLKWKDIDFEKADRVIFLGNLFCSGVIDNNRPQDCAVMRSNILEIVSKKRKEPNKYTLLLGKDDLHLMFPETYDKPTALKRMKEEDLKLAKSICRNHISYLSFFCQVGNFLFTPGGVTKKWFNKAVPPLVTLLGAGLTNDGIATILNKAMLVPEMRSLLVADGFEEIGDWEVCGPYYTDEAHITKNGFKRMNQVVCSDTRNKLSSSGDYKKKTGVFNVNIMEALEKKGEVENKILKLIL